MSHTCHHHDGLVCVIVGAGEVRSYIVQILKPSRKDHDDMHVKEGLVLDARLLDKVLQTPIITMDIIPHTCRLAFSHALKDALYQVDPKPNFVGA